MGNLEVSNKISGEFDANTGCVKIDSYEALSGFEFLVGIRAFEGLKIVESICRGTAIELLSSIKVFDGSNVLILDIPVVNGIKYSRERVRVFVRDGLLGMLEDASRSQGKEFSKEKVKAQLDQKLKMAYFEQTYKSILNWADAIGINFK